MSTHPVVTQDYEENLHGGVMVCGINFGFSRKDELQELKNTGGLKSEVQHRWLIFNEW